MMQPPPAGGSMTDYTIGELRADDGYFDALIDW